MDEARLIELINKAIDANEADMAALRADKPGVESKRSDGKRVRYVRREESAATLRAVLEWIEAAR